MAYLAEGIGGLQLTETRHIDEGIEILTGVKAGERGEDGKFEAGTINYLVEEKLCRFAERAKAFGRRVGGDDEDKLSAFHSLHDKKEYTSKVMSFLLT